MFCVALGAGVMVSTGCLVLIPEVRLVCTKCRRLSDPLMKLRLYQRLLLLCVAMGAGVMVSTGCLVFIPEVRFGLYHSYHH